MVSNGLSLRHKIAGLTSGLVLLSLLFGGVLVARSAARAVEGDLGQRAISVARTVAQLEAVRVNLGEPAGLTLIQPIAERIRLATGVEYVVILDMQRIRYSHVLAERIGTRFESGDVGPALAQQAYVSPAQGVNGRSVRAFVPVMSLDGSEQVGVVVVGILVPGMLQILQQFRTELLMALLGSLGIGVVGAWLLAANIKRQMFDMEPREMARLLEERVATFSAVSEALIAIDTECRITVMNDEAKRMAGLPPEANPVGQPVYELIPDSRLPEVVRTGQGVRNQQRLLGRTLILTNRVPIYHRGRLIGALATFRDRTEVTRLAEDLTGITQLVDGLRATNHEALNKLHTIAGLIQLGEYKEALAYIFSVTERQQELARFLARDVREYQVAGLLLGKVNRARELGVTLDVDRRSRVEGIPSPLEGSDLAVIIGNLVENGIEAALAAPPPRRVSCLVQGGQQGMLIQVEDSGGSLPPSGPERERLFEPGFSTKGGSNRGIGLALVKELADFAGGTIELGSEPGRTVFQVWLPGGDASGDDPGAGGR